MTASCTNWFNLLCNTHIQDILILLKKKKHECSIKCSFVVQYIMYLGLKDILLCPRHILILNDLYITFIYCQCDVEYVKTVLILR